MRPRISIRGFVRPSVRRSVRPSVGPLRLCENRVSRLSLATVRFYTKTNDQPTCFESLLSRFTRLFVHLSLHICHMIKRHRDTAWTHHCPVGLVFHFTFLIHFVLQVFHSSQCSPVCLYLTFLIHYVINLLPLWCFFQWKITRISSYSYGNRARRKNLVDSVRRLKLVINLIKLHCNSLSRARGTQVQWLARDTRCFTSTEI